MVSDGKQTVKAYLAEVSKEVGNPVALLRASSDLKQAKVSKKKEEDFGNGSSKTDEINLGRIIR